jgi:ferredoxin
MLVIDPETCIDCELCVPECPVNAIYPEDELPDQFAEWLERNAELYAEGEPISEKGDALEGAKTLEELQKAEKENGWEIDEPSKAF